MKKVILLAVGALALASVTAYAQMHHRNAPSHTESGTPQGQMHGPMHEQMQKKMQGKMHGKMHMQGQHGGHQGAQGAQGGHDAHGAAGPRRDRGPASLAFHGINEKMHAGMNIAFTGNVDADFVNGMIPHHQGAVEMAKVVLAFGRDPEIRRLAEEIVKAQESEIAMMRAWLKRNAQ